MSQRRRPPACDGLEGTREGVSEARVIKGPQGSLGGFIEALPCLHQSGHTLRLTPPAGVTSSTTSLAAQRPLKYPSRATARASAPCASASLTPLSGMPPVPDRRRRHGALRPPQDRIRNTASDSALRLHIKWPHAYRPIPHLDPALRARLESALQRPDLKPTTRAKIEPTLKQ